MIHRHGMGRSAAPWKGRWLLVTLMLVLVQSAMAHTLWLQPGVQPGHYRLLFGGHQGRLEPFQPAKLTALQGWGVDARPVAVERRQGADGWQVTAPAAAVLTAAYDNGYWSRLDDGRSIEKPADQVTGAVEQIHALKFHKLIARWDTPAATRVYGQPYELVPLAATRPVAGQPMHIRVLIDGRPAAGIALAEGEEGATARTGIDGVAVWTPHRGINRIWSGRRTVTNPGQPVPHQESIEYSLVFVAR